MGWKFWKTSRGTTDSLIETPVWKRPFKSGEICIRRHPKPVATADFIIEPVNGLPFSRLKEPIGGVDLVYERGSKHVERWQRVSSLVWQNVAIELIRRAEEKPVILLAYGFEMGARGGLAEAHAQLEGAVFTEAAATTPTYHTQPGFVIGAQLNAARALHLGPHVPEAEVAGLFVWSAEPTNSAVRRAFSALDRGFRPPIDGLLAAWWQYDWGKVLRGLSNQGVFDWLTDEMGFRPPLSGPPENLPRLDPPPDFMDTAVRR